MTGKTRRLLIAFATLGLMASAWSSYVHYSLLTVPGYTSFCDVSGAVSCTHAYLSQYGSMWGVPVSLGGMVYFSVVLMLAAFAARRPGVAWENVPAYVFSLSTVALAFVMYLAWASFFKLHALCVLCAITDVAVVALFIISGGASTLPMTSLPRRATADLAALVRSPLALVLAAVLAGGAFVLFNVFPREAHAAAIAAGKTDSPQVELLTEQEKANFIKQYEALPRVSVPIDAGGAKVLVVKFNDYQCPPCRQSYMEYKWAIAKYQALGQLKFVLKHFPLERECNAAISGDLHLASCEAAAAVVMAQSRGTADKLEEWFFANQPSLTPERVKEAAATVGGITDFDAQYARALTLVRTDAGLGALLGARSTPTFLVNGRVVAGALPAAYFELAIEHELKR
jgi:uncharacterized membrane protein/protein-disulfide isomerase